MAENEKLIKDENEAIEAIKSNMPTSGYYMLRESLDMAIKALEEVQEYRKLGTVEECREAVDKTKVRTMIESEFKGIKFFQCPECDEMLNGKERYCPECGCILESEE